MIDYFPYIFISSILLFIILTSIDLDKAILAFVSLKPTPTYFEILPLRLASRHKQHLFKHDKYYRDLSQKLKRSFESRVAKFMNSKKFKTRQGLKLTHEMKLLIASSAIKITFGLRNFTYPLFHTIIIYPKEYFSEIFQVKVKGETNAAGLIVFSWEDLKFGDSNPNDSINLGYHELAHALFLDNLMIPYETYFKEHYRNWLMFVKNNSKLDEVRRKHIFREYATVNEFEFFAVALENFFENPEHFKEELPMLYKQMAKMLNQDPLEAQSS